MKHQPSLFSAILTPLLVALGLYGGAARAQTPVPQPARLMEPPYLVTGANLVMLGVVWDAEVVKRVLPAGLQPTPELSGGINIYQASGGYGVGPYQSAYFWVDVDGHDSSSGVKGRWMMEGVYGPDPRPAATLVEYAGFPVRSGGSRFVDDGKIRQAIGSVAGHDFVSVKIKTSTDCSPAASMLTYTTHKGLIEIPFTGSMCKAEPVSVDVTARAGDPFAAFKPQKILWAAEVKDAIFTITRTLPPGF